MRTRRSKKKGAGIPRDKYSLSVIEKPPVLLQWLVRYFGRTAEKAVEGGHGVCRGLRYKNPGGGKEKVLLARIALAD